MRNRLNSSCWSVQFSPSNRKNETYTLAKHFRDEKFEVKKGTTNLQNVKVLNSSIYTTTKKFKC